MKPDAIITAIGNKMERKKINPTIKAAGATTIKQIKHVPFMAAPMLPRIVQF